MEWEERELKKYWITLDIGDKISYVLGAVYLPRAVLSHFYGKSTSHL
jgi:hypothetical protein